MYEGTRYKPKYYNISRMIVKEKGFFLSLEPIDGAIETVKRLSKKHDIWFCSKPHSEYKNCVLEKYMWIEKYFGKEWTKKIILTHSKSLVYGDILIDDLVHIPHPSKKPCWKYVCFRQPYNMHVESELSMRDWSDLTPIDMAIVHKIIDSNAINTNLHHKGEN